MAKVVPDLWNLTGCTMRLASTGNEMLFALACLVALLWLAREELGLLGILGTLGFLVVAGVALGAFQVSPLFFTAILAVVDVFLVILVYGDIVVR